MTRLVQIKKGIVRRVALVEEPHLRVLDGCNSVFELAQSAIKSGTKLSDMVRKRLTSERLDYDPCVQRQLRVAIAAADRSS